jgi:hypothetical protein
MKRVAILLLMLTASTALADVQGSYAYDGRTRVVLGLTVSGHVLLSAGVERLATEHLSLRLELLWAIADVPAFGAQLDGGYRFPLDGSSAASESPAGRWGLLHAGVLKLFARESPGQWRALTLPHLSPGLRWGLRDSGGMDLELPIAWMAQQHTILPLGLQSRWWPQTH